MVLNSTPLRDDPAAAMDSPSCDRASTPWQGPFSPGTSSSHRRACSEGGEREKQTGLGGHAILMAVAMVIGSAAPITVLQFVCYKNYHAREI